MITTIRLYSTSTEDLTADQGALQSHFSHSNEQPRNGFSDISFQDSCTILVGNMQGSSKNILQDFSLGFKLVHTLVLTNTFLVDTN